MSFSASLWLGGQASGRRRLLAMDAPESPPPPDAALDESTELLRRRLRTVLLLGLPPIVLFAVFDLFLLEPGQLRRKSMPAETMGGSPDESHVRASFRT